MQVCVEGAVLRVELRLESREMLGALPAVDSNEHRMLTTVDRGEQVRAQVAVGLREELCPWAIAP